MSPGKSITLFILIFSLVSSSLIFLIKNKAISRIGIVTNSEMGQQTNHGYYSFGDYTAQVNELIRERSLVKNGHILNRYPPVYPFLLFAAYLTASFLSLKMSILLVFMAAVFNALSAIVLVKILALFNVQRKYLLITAFIFLTHPYILQGITKVMSVTPFMTFIYFSLYLFLSTILRPGKKDLLRMFITGLSLGAAILIRPIGLLLPVAFLVIYAFYCFRHTRPGFLIHAVVLIAGSLIIISPWEVWNAKHGAHILIADNDTHTIVKGLSFHYDLGKERINLPSDVDQLAEKIHSRHIKTRAELFSTLRKEFTNHPATFIELFVIKAGRSWYGVYSQNRTKEILKLILFILYGSFTTIGMIRMIRKYPDFSLLILTFLILTLYFWAMTIIADSMARYMIPVFGLMCLFIPGLFMGKNKMDHADHGSQVSSKTSPTISKSTGRGWPYCS